MVKIRLRRTGAKHQPSYRVVVTESTSPRDGRFIEKIGNYNPRTQPASFDVQEDRALYWLSVGAQPSDAVLRILDKVGTLARFKRMRAGESLEVLVAEAAANPLAPVDQRTRRDDIKPVSKKKAAIREVAAATAVASAPVAEAVLEAEAEAPALEAAAEADVEASEESTESAAE